MFDATSDHHRCQGCGHEPGDIVTVWTGRKHHQQRVTALTEIRLLDEPPRLYCGRCRSLARRRNKRAAEAHLTLNQALIDWQAPLPQNRERGR